jgi:hypothetical protein
MIPTENEHTITLPKEFYGKKVEVIAFSLPEDPLAMIENNDPGKFYDSIKLDFSHFKFNRNDANER